jgi:tetratricopeptide (TPR) repeat protein
LYNKPVNLKQPVHKKIETYISQIGATKAIEEYKKMKADSAHYYIDWISMNFIAEQLLTLKRYDDAGIIAENNVAEFPDKDLVMLTMGNIYLALNRKADAAAYYKKTLAITPGYEEAKNRLKELEGK